MPKEQIASLKKSSINPATQDPARLSVSMATESSVWVTLGCGASANNGEMDAHELADKRLYAKKDNEVIHFVPQSVICFAP